jgi:hypothetical protein
MKLNSRIGKKPNLPTGASIASIRCLAAATQQPSLGDYSATG